MKLMALRHLVRYATVVLLVCMISCRSQRVYTSSATSGSYHSSYDDTTLTPDNSEILMPYNRFIDPAGTVVRFGDRKLENHSLDLVLLPGGRIVAVEDRYGLALLDIETNRLIYHLDYGTTAPFKGLMSTFSGIKIKEIEKDVSTDTPADD